MAERPTKGKEGEKSFADFLKAAPAASEALGDDSVPLTGVVYRSDKEGQFVLATPDGQTLELNADDVKSYEVVQETGPQKVVNVNVSAKALSGGAGGIGGAAARTLVTDLITRKELIKDPLLDYTRKELVKDPFKDPSYDPWTLVENQGTIQEGVDPTGGLGGGDPGFEAGGLTPFIMATPHHASAAAVGMQAGAAAGAALTLKELIQDPHTRKELFKDPILDTRKELIKDPLTDPYTWVENTGTIQEQVFDPGLGNVINPAAGGAGVQQPLAGPEAGINAAAAALTFKELIQDPHTRKELIKDPIFDNTRKELIKDPLTDPYTWVENTGTIQEQVFDPGLGNVINPATNVGGVAGGGLQQPFAGPEAGGGGAAAALKPIYQERITRKEIIYDTIKEITKDPLWDTRKEVFETYVEGGGTIQEGPGGIDPGAVWNLPGMMF